MDPEIHALDLVIWICISDVIFYICDLGRSLCVTNMSPSVQPFFQEIPHSLTLLDVQVSFFILSHSWKQVFLHGTLVPFIGEWLYLPRSEISVSEIALLICEPKKEDTFFFRSSVQHCLLTALFRGEVGEEMYLCNMYALKSFPTYSMKDNGFVIYVHK